MAKLSIASVRWITLIVSFMLFGFCLFNNALYTPYIDGDVENRSIYFLYMGWLGVPIAFVLFFTTFSFVPVFAFITARHLNRKSIYIPLSIVSLITLTAMHVLGYASWLANPLLLLAAYFMLRGFDSIAFMTAASALWLTMSVLTVGNLPFGLKEAFVPVSSFDSGYWFWVAAAAVMVVGTGVNLIAVSANRGSPPIPQLPSP